MRHRQIQIVTLFVAFSATAACSQERANPRENRLSDTDYEIAEVYSSLRSQALEFRSEQNAEPEGGVIAALMETGYPEAVVTLLAVSDGTVSLYFSNGGGIIGAGEHEPVRRVARRFLESAGQFLSQAPLTETYPLPVRDQVRFYLVTSSGIHLADALEQDLGNNRHAISPLFYAGHELITAIRESTPQ